MNINAHTKLYCIFGSPVKHSMSPAMHNAAFTEAGLNAAYMAFEPDSIEGAIQAMRGLPIYGASVTIPFKTVVMPYLDRIDPLAEKIGSVNTLKNIDGTITGYNTDGYGAMLSLEQNGIKVKGANILVLGNGGSARAIAFTLLQENARVIIAGRNSARIQPLIDDLKKNSGQAECILLNELTADFTAGMDIIINTTPIGMTPDTDKTPIDENLIHKTNSIMDIVYSPPVTRLLDAGMRKGCNTIHGLNMLLYQGVKQFEIWTGKPAPVKVMKNALKNEMKDDRRQT